MKREKKYLMYGIALIMLTLIGVSLAYFSTVIVGDKKEISVDFADLKVVFNGSNDITGTDIEPGWSDSITFSVENKTKREYNYNIVLEDFINTFKTSGYLVYKITSDNGYNMEDYKDLKKSISKKDYILEYNISLSGNTTHNYTIEFLYLNDDDVDQSVDMNSTLCGKVYISDGIINPFPKDSLAYNVLVDNPTISERTDFSVLNTENTTGIIYKISNSGTKQWTEDTDGDGIGEDVFYYSGNTENNWVKFGKYSISQVIGYYSSTSSSIAIYDTLEGCNSAKLYNYNCHYLYKENEDIYWRIIRTNEDGSVRLLYAGNNPNTTDGYIRTSEFNKSYSTSKNAGYMYGGNESLDDNRANITDSTIKGVIDTWYQNNLLTYYDKYISKSAIYCNERSIGSGTWNTSSSFTFGASTRLSANKTPTYKCGGNTSGGLFESTQAVADKFSASTTGGGNGQLKYPVALMTADEIAFAGGGFNGIYVASNPYAYYNNNSDGDSIVDSREWWLLSPSNWSSNGTMIFYINASFSDGYRLGSISWRYANFENGVRPVISISSCAKVTGTGTPEDPYVIDEANSTC